MPVRSTGNKEITTGYPIDGSGVQEALMLDKEHADGKCGDNLRGKLVGDTLHIFGTGEPYPWA